MFYLQNSLQHTVKPTFPLLSTPLHQHLHLHHISVIPLTKKINRSLHLNFSSWLKASIIIFFLKRINQYSAMWSYSIYILIVIMLPVTNAFLLMLVKDNLDLMFIRLAWLFHSFLDTFSSQWCFQLQMLPMHVKFNLNLMFIRLAGLLQSLVLNDKQLLQSSDCTDALRPYNGWDVF